MSWWQGGHWCPCGSCGSNDSSWCHWIGHYRAVDALGIVRIPALPLEHVCLCFNIPVPTRINIKQVNYHKHDHNGNSSDNIDNDLVIISDSHHHHRHHHQHHQHHQHQPLAPSPPSGSAGWAWNMSRFSAHVICLALDVDAWFNIVELLAMAAFRFSPVMCIACSVDVQLE